MARRKTLSPKPLKKTEARERAEEQYRCERGRIMNMIRRAEKQGYVFDENLFVPLRQRDLPEMTTQKLKSLTKELHKINALGIRIQAVNPTQQDIDLAQHPEMVKRAKKIVANSNRRKALEQARFQQKYKREIALLIEKEQEEAQEEQRIREQFNIPEYSQPSHKQELEIEDLELTPIPEATVGEQKLTPKTSHLDPFFGTQEDLETERDFQKEVRKYNRVFQKAKQADPFLTKEEFDVRWRQMKEDSAVLKRARHDYNFRTSFEVGRSAYRQVVDMIKDVDAVHKDSANYLSRLLEKEISSYGEDTVIKNIAQAPDYLIEASSIALFYKEGSSSFNNAVSAIHQIIKGDIPSAEESAELASLTEQVEDPSEEYE
jgi:hypothetical protein